MNNAENPIKQAMKTCENCMNGRIDWNSKMAQDVTSQLCDSYAKGIGVSYSENNSIPERDVVVGLLESMLDLLFPGYTGRREITQAGQFFTVGNMLNQFHSGLASQIANAFSYKC